MVLQGLQNCIAVSRIPRQLEEGEVAGVALAGVGARDDGPALEGVEGGREIAIPRLSGVVAGEGHYVLCGRGGRPRTEEGGKGGWRGREERERKGRRKSTHNQPFTPHQHTAHAHENSYL